MKGDDGYAEVLCGVCRMCGSDGDACGTRAGMGIFQHTA